MYYITSTTQRVSSAILQYYLCMEARGKGVKVLLTMSFGVIKQNDHMICSMLQNE